MSIARPFHFDNPFDRHGVLSEILADDARMARLGRRLLLAAVVLLVGLAAYYGYDRYVVKVDSPITQATRTLEERIRQTPNDVDLRMQMAGLYAQQERYDEAVSQYQEVLAARANWTPALLALASVEQARGNDPRAEQLYRQVADSFQASDLRYGSKDLQVVYYRLGTFASKAGRNDEAAYWAGESLKVDATDSDALYLLGTAQEQQGHLEDAQDALKQAVSFDPSFGDAWGALQRVCVSLNDHPLAEYAAGMQQYAGGNAAGALVTFKHIVDGSPGFAPAYEGMGLAYAKQDDGENARSAFRAALDRDPDLLLAQWSLRSLGGDR